MPAFSRPLAALAAALLLSACGPELTQLEQGILDAHNQVRANAQPAPSPPLSPLLWSQAAASTAQAWANGCAFNHNPDRGNLGENIAAFSPAGSSTPDSVVNIWAEEASSYDYATDTCSGTCGHYTQIVWRATTKVGCARASCTGASSPFGDNRAWDFWVCDYDPAGNTLGQKPY